MKQTARKNKWFWYVLMIVCCCGIQISSAGIGNCLGLFYKPMADEFGVGIGGISVNQTVRMIVGSTMGLFVNFFYDKLGSRICTVSGCTLIFLSAFGQAFATRPLQLVMLAFTEGIGRGLTSTFLVKMVINNWFEKMQGTAFGIASCSSGIFGAVFNPVLSRYIQKLGWRRAMIILSVTALVCMAPAMIFLRLSPDSYGMKAYGASEEDQGTDPAEVEKTDVQGGTEPVRKMKLHIDVTFMLVVCLGYLTSICAPLMNHMASFTGSLGFDPDTAALMVSAMMVGNLLFKLVLGVLCDRIGALWTALIGYCTIIVSGMLFLYGEGRTVCLLAAFLYGAWYGLSLVAITQYTNRMFPKQEYGKYFSIYLFFTQGLSGFNSAVVGYMYDFTGSYHSVLKLSFLIVILAAAIMLTLEGISRRKERMLLQS